MGLVFFCNMKKAKQAPKKSKKPVDPDLQVLGRRIREIRKNRGYTSFEIFAYEKGFSRITYGKMELGQNITYKNLLKFVRAVNMSLKDFFAEGFD